MYIVIICVNCTYALLCDRQPYSDKMCAKMRLGELNTVHLIVSPATELYSNN